MKTIKLYNGQASDRQLQEISRDLANGDTMIWPTDTIYGIACDALEPKAIEKICKLKGINPEKELLSIVCSDIAQAAEYAKIDNTTFKLMKELTPGPYTFICRAASTLPKAFKGRKTVGIRIPDNATCLAIVERLGHPVMTTSIEFDDDDEGSNPGLISERYENRVNMFLEGENGLTEPSTVIDCTAASASNPPTLIRPGLGPFPA